MIKTSLVIIFESVGLAIFYCEEVIYKDFLWGGGGGGGSKKVFLNLPNKLVTDY